ncbi:hypothetical protein I904_gp02 [Vibrio phage VvAW1]|uniref:hypothetical protein n=1 Tax=Vibrio phage VvAW1 TaxID=1168281 RepID=UPI000263B063|nr:hypothetical protein I904_gp02 [Vibrio phage VvAW1]AFH14474.1 hypothetical protein VvAW1_00002c [Vibrio phage VvAW1]
MANALGIDLGQVYRTVESVKGARQSRENNALMMDWKKEDRDAARQRSNALSELRGKASTGDQQAMQQLNAFDPEEAKKMLDSLSKMDERQRQQTQENIDAVGKMSAYVLQSENPEQAYQLARQSVSPELAAKMPEQYDPNFLQMQLARARQIDELLQNPERMTFGTEDRLYKDGRVIERTTSSQELDRQTSRQNALTRASGDGGLKSADESLMYRQAGELLGGLFDQQGNLQNLDPATRGKVQSIATEAAKIYSQGGVTRSQAVTQAARKLGIQVQDLGQSGNIDRNKLLEMYSQ